MSVIDLKEKTSVQAHINMMQGMINRMAANSANCKLWCVTILTASLALFFDGKTSNIEYCYLVILIFFFLDCFYLGLERQFVRSQNDFVKKINECTNVEDIGKQIFVPYTLKKRKEEECWITRKAKHFGKQFWYTIKAIGSFSTTPFYGTIALVVYLLLKQ